ncbi:hypothetical protein TNCV_2946341 [Trichonephila clavipes]|nr:hypothetical protein TNCV_2946341 [Trichonephila clavipes]
MCRRLRYGVSELESSSTVTSEDANTITKRQRFHKNCFTRTQFSKKFFVYSSKTPHKSFQGKKGMMPLRRFQKPYRQLNDFERGLIVGMREAGRLYLAINRSSPATYRHSCAKMLVAMIAARSL